MVDVCAAAGYASVMQDSRPAIDETIEAAGELLLPHRATFPGPGGLRLVGHRQDQASQPWMRCPDLRFAFRATSLMLTSRGRACATRLHWHLGGLRGSLSGGGRDVHRRLNGRRRCNWSREDRQRLGALRLLGDIRVCGPVEAEDALDLFVRAEVDRRVPRRQRRGTATADPRVAQPHSLERRRRGHSKSIGVPVLNLRPTNCLLVRSPG